jgi:hypothetical protein
MLPRKARVVGIAELSCAGAAQGQAITLSWQVIPSVLGKMSRDRDAEKSKRVMKAMLQMDKN